MSTAAANPWPQQPFQLELDDSEPVIADIERVHRENGRTEYEEPLDLSKAVDETFTKKAIETLGAM